MNGDVLESIEPYCLQATIHDSNDYVTDMLRARDAEREHKRKSVVRNPSLPDRWKKSSKHY